MELALIKERSEREKIEKQNLENLKMSLEAEKRKVDEELAAERALALDKDALLQRTVKREAELEEELADLQADAELLDSQLTRAMKLQKEQEEKNADLRQMFDQAADHLVRLESEQKLWVGKESELSGQLAAAQEEIDNLRREILALEKATEDLKALREQDLARAHDRNEVMVKELQGKLDIELKTKYASGISSLNAESLTYFVGNCFNLRLRRSRPRHVRQRSSWQNWRALPTTTLT